MKSVQGTLSPFVTGIGYLTSNHELIAHPDQNIRYSSGIEGLELSPILCTSGQYWVFIFHDACWSLLLERIDREGDNVADIGRLLFQILYCTPWNRYYTAKCGQNYGGASELQGPGNSYSSSPPSFMQSLLTADPQEYICTSTQESSLFRNLVVPTIRSGQIGGTDMFCMLPDEIIVIILNELASTDICNLRKSSKRVAWMSTLRTLPQSFWASRFAREREMGFALACQSPARLENPTDWRRLYFAFKKSL